MLSGNLRRCENTTIDAIPITFLMSIIPRTETCFVYINREKYALQEITLP
jgi:hypothetical protein